jgi:hypothetical protein
MRTLPIKSSAGWLGCQGRCCIRFTARSRSSEKDSSGSARSWCRARAGRHDHDRTGANPILLPWLLIVYATLIMFAGQELWRIR